MKKLLTLSLLATGLLFGTAYADDSSDVSHHNWGNVSTVQYPAGQTNGSFHCKVEGTTAGETVKIDTDSVNAEGFCAGSPYVTAPGHIDGLPVTTLATSFFQINKSLIRSGSVKVTLNGAGGVYCKSGDGNGRTSYGAGHGYCLAGPTK